MGNNCDYFDRSRSSTKTKKDVFGVAILNTPKL